MDKSKLLNLDIRLIDPLFHTRKGRNSSSNELGIFYWDNSKLNVLHIKNGNDIFKEGIERIIDSQCEIPHVSPNQNELIANILDKFNPELIRLYPGDFEKIIDDFIAEYVLNRIESNITTLTGYLEYGKNQGVMRSTAQQHVMRNQLVDRLISYITEAPALLNLPHTKPKQIYRGVRLKNRLANCIVRNEQRKNIGLNRKYPANVLAICDVVFEYSPEEVYVIQVKTSYTRQGRTPHYFKRNLKVKSQSKRIALFLDKNFHCNPILIDLGVNSALNNNNISINRYSLLKGELVKVDD